MNTGYPKWRVGRRIATVVLVAVIVYCGMRLMHITENYRQEAAIHSALMAYKPGAPNPIAPLNPANPLSSAGPLNPTAPLNPVAQHPPEAPLSQLAALRMRNADVAGWLEIPGTEIDYPFVRGSDNSAYLGIDFDKNPAAAGTLFMDFRNDLYFGDFNTLIYGHNMKNRSMFGSLNRFNDANFFNTHTSAVLRLDDGDYTLEIFAFLTVTANNAAVYQLGPPDAAARSSYLSYIAAHARRYRDIGVTPEDRVVTLSTCAYAFDNARYVLIARIVK